MNMKDCAWPSGCHQTSTADSDFCSYHLRVSGDTIAPSQRGSAGRPPSGSVSEGKKGHRPGSETKGKGRK